MPKRPFRPCKYPVCKTLTRDHYCEKHKDIANQQRKELQKRTDKKRGNANQRGYTYKWSKARKSFLEKNPLCVHCQQQGIVKAAEVVDHIIPHKGDQKLFWDKTNWQPLCKKCHDRKTVAQDGGFGIKSGFVAI